MTRRGASLVELVVALTLFGIVAGAIMRALDRQARFHDGIARILEARTQLSATHDALAVELRGASTAAADVESVTDSSIVYRTPVGSAVACAIADPVLTLAPESLASGETLVHFRTAPQPGDTAWIFDEGPRPDDADDRWVPAPIVSATRVTGACTGSAFVDAQLDATKIGWRLTTNAGVSLPVTVGAGSVIRITRPARFALYRASTGETFLGWTDWNAAAHAWNVIQPVSGPFLAYDQTRPSASGVAFQGWDSASTALPSGSIGPAISRLSVAARAVTRGVVRMDGVPRGLHVDSLGSTIGVRNWR